MSSQKFQIPFDNIIAKFSRKYISSLEPLKAQMLYALNSKSLRINGSKYGSAKTMACKVGGLLGLDDLSRTDLS